MCPWTYGATYRWSGMVQPREWTSNQYHKNSHGRRPHTWLNVEQADSSYWIHNSGSTGFLYQCHHCHASISEWSQSSITESNAAGRITAEKTRGGYLQNQAGRHQGMISILSLAKFFLQYYAAKTNGAYCLCWGAMQTARINWVFHLGLIKKSLPAIREE